MAQEALDNAGIGYRVAYTSIHCAGQEAAMVADLAVFAFPASMVKSPLTRLVAESGLPPIGDYQILLLRQGGLGSASKTLAGYVKEMFEGFRRY